MVFVDYTFVLVFGFDCSCRRVLLFFLPNSCSYDLKNCFYLTFFGFVCRDVVAGLNV